MNNRYLFVAFLFAVVSLMTSCLSDDETTVIYYDDAAVTSFALGKLNCTVNTVSSKTGNDTTYVTQVSGSLYNFSIDHNKGLIYNVDSLPVGADTKKCLVTIQTRNSGMAYLKGLTSDSLTYIVATDSLDFSQPRKITILSNDGSWTKEYTVEVRVHTEKANKLYWAQKQKSSQIASLKDMKAVAYGSDVYAFGMANGSAKVYKTAAADGDTWNEVGVPFASFGSVVTNGKMVYAHADGGIWASDNMQSWTWMADANSIKTLAAASANEVYAIATDGKMLKSTDNGAHWDYDALGSEAQYLPQQNICSVCKQSKVNPDVERVIVLGNRGVDTDETSMVWSKTVDNGNPDYSQPWIHQFFDDSTWHHAPLFANMSVTSYADGMLMMGVGSDVTDTTTSAFSLYYSWDEGLNWWVDKRYTMPEGITSDPTSFALVADNNRCFWILCGNSGQVWKGHHTAWTWK